MAYFSFDNIRVFYSIKGHGAPLLLLHGNTASSKMFDAIISKYAKNFQVITIDLPGHGKSDRLKKFKTDFWYYNAKVCNQLINFLNLDRVSVIGTSGGALIAINLGLAYPERVNYLIADSFAGEFPLDSYIKSMVRDREIAKENAYAKSFWNDNHGHDWKNIVDLDIEMLLNFSNLNKSFFHKPISELSVPTLLTGSKNDEYFHSLEKTYNTIKKKNDIIEIHLFESGSHPAMISNKKEFLVIIEKKLKSV